MSMSFADVVPLPGVAGGSLREESVGAQRAVISCELVAATGEQPVLPAAMLGLPAAMLGAASVSLERPAGEVVSSGFRELDQLLPAGGIRRGSLVEWLPAMKTPPTKTAAGKAAVPRAVGMARGGVQWNAAAGESVGSGVFTLAMAIAVQVARASAGEGDAGGGQSLRGRFQEEPPRRRRLHNTGASKKSLAGAMRAGAVLVVDRSGWFYPPAVMRWFGGGAAGVCCQLIVARPSRDDDEIWAIDQALRCGGVAAVVASPSASIVCSKVMRRWQLAARVSGAVGMFVRPWQCRRDPSWAEARLVVMPLRRPRSAAEAKSPVEAERASRFRESLQAPPAVPPEGGAGAARNARLAEGRLRGPAVAPRSEAVLRQWQVERLSSLLYGEGRSCEVLLDLERGVEPPQAARLRRQTPSRQPMGQPAMVPSAALPAAVQPSVEREPCDAVLQFRVGERQEQDRSETAEGGEGIGRVFGEEGVACRAS